MRKLLCGILAAATLCAAYAFPFVPVAATANLAVTATAQSLTLPTSAAATSQVTSTTDFGLQQYVLTNIGTQTVFCRGDGTTATVSNATPILGNSQIVISLPKATTTLSCIASTTGSTLYATVGVGE